MAPVVSCPDVQSWRRLLLGHLPEDEAKNLERHLEECGACLQIVREVHVDDTLADALRSWTPVVERDEPETVQELIQRLKGLRFRSGETGPEETAPGISQSDLGRNAPIVDQGQFTEEVYDFLAPPQGPGEIGRLGSYRVLKVLGVGGMGVVFLAEDPSLKRLVALKALKPALASREAARRRFLREAQATAALEHDHIVPIYQVGEDRCVPFLAMPVLKGETLEARLAREERLPVVEVLRIGREVALGLAAAHKQGLIHRDVKPANIWLEEETGRVKIVDFGLARAASGDVQLTQEGAVVGTPAYMAPEQATGQPLDARCDLFSLGCVLYRAATGQVPFGGTDTVSTLLAVATQRPIPPGELNPELPLALSEMILRLLAKQPGQRLASARDVVDAIDVVTASPRACPAGVFSSEEKPGGASPPARRRLLVALAAVLFVALLLWGATAVLQTKDGTLTVTTMEPDVKVLIDGEEKIVIDSKKVGKIVLVPGAHTLMVKRGDEELYTKSFTLKSGGTPVIHATWEPRVARKDPERAEPPLPPSPLDKLDAKQIPAASRFDWHPPELVAVLGESGQRHFGSAVGAAWIADGKFVVSAGSDGVLTLWDAATMRRRLELCRQERGFSALAISPDGNTLACGCAARKGERSIRLWDFSGAEPKEKPGILQIAENRPVFSLAFAPDGKTLAIGTPEWSVRLWDLRGESPKETVALEGHNDGVGSLAFSSDGKMLACGGREGPVWLWDLSGAKPKEKAVLPGHTKQVVQAAFTPDGKALASGGADGLLRIWDLSGGQPVEGDLLQGKPVAAIAFSPDGQTLAVGRHDGSTTLWTLGAPQRALKQKSRLPGDVYSLSLQFSSDGKSLLTCGRDGAVRRWDLKDPEPKERSPLTGHIGPVNQMVFTAGDQQLISAGRGWEVRSWDLTSVPPRETPGNTALAVNGLTLAPDGKALAGKGEAQSPVALFDLVGTEWKKWAEVGPATSAAFAPDRKTLAASYPAEGIVRLWDLSAKEPKERDSMKVMGTAIDNLAFSADGRKLAGCYSSTIYLWDLSGPQPKMHRLPVSGATVGSLVFSMDGKVLASGFRDGRVQLWDVGEALPQAGVTLQGHDEQITGLAFSPNGARLASAEGPGRVVVWDMVTRKKVQEWHIAVGVLSLTFAGDSRHLAIGTGRGPIYLLRLAGPP
jgi:WD40 repeat protein